VFGWDPKVLQNQSPLAFSRRCIWGCRNVWHFLYNWKTRVTHLLLFYLQWKRSQKKWKISQSQLLRSEHIFVQQDGGQCLPHQLHITAPPRILSTLQQKGRKNIPNTW